MTRKNTLLLGLALGLFTSFHASADTIALTGFSGSSASVNITLTNGTDYHTGTTGISFNEGGGAGSFTTFNSTTGETFQSWCVDIFHKFNFGSQSTTSDSLYTATSKFGTTKANELGSLYTIYAQNKGANDTSSMNPAFQLAVWAVVNTPDASTPSISGPVFSASSTADVNAKAAALLTQMASTKSLYTASIWSVASPVKLDAGKPSWGSQDVVVFSQISPVPEPESYAMLLAGLGLVGAAVQRRKAKQA